MRLISKHIVMVVDKVRTKPTVSISCSASSVMDKLVVVTDKTEAGVFNFMFTDEQMKLRVKNERDLLWEIKREDPSQRFVSEIDAMTFRDVQRKLWTREAAGTRLYTKHEGWLSANRAGLRLEHVMDAIAMHDFDLVASSKTYNARFHKANGFGGNYDDASHEYIFRRR